MRLGLKLVAALFLAGLLGTIGLAGGGTASATSAEKHMSTAAPNAKPDCFNKCMTKCGSKRGCAGGCSARCK